MLRRLLAVLLIWIITLLCFTSCHDTSDDVTISKVDTEKHSKIQDRRYLLYDVNYGEGFNLRRDVYMRVANMVRVLREQGHNFILVLPPWGGLYHWQTKSIGKQNKIPWSTFFDLRSLNRFVPVIEFEKFLAERNGDMSIDQVFYLQHYEEGWGGKWEEKWDYRTCLEMRMYREDKQENIWRGWFFEYSDVYAKKLDCISIQGHSASLIPLITQQNLTANSIMVDRAETVLHDMFGDMWYWKARRSMRFAKHLTALGDKFRQAKLNSTDDMDETLMTEDWRDMKPKHGTAKGGPFLCVHWRRKDFVMAHGPDLPSVEGTADQINDLLETLELKTVFVATDAPAGEVKQLRANMNRGYKLVQYKPTEKVLTKYGDGGVAIIDQWICSHARYFTGSHVSTFSFRIQDEREIFGFDPTTTFNKLCPDKDSKCEQPAHWTMKYS